MKSNGSKFSKLIAGLVAASSIMPIVGVNTSISAMENEINEFQKEKQKIFDEILAHAPFVDGITNQQIFGVLIQIVPNALRKFADCELRKRPYSYMETLKKACAETNLKNMVSGQLLNEITPRDDDNPTIRLYNVINNDADMENIIKKIANLHCKGKIGFDM